MDIWLLVIRHIKSGLADRPRAVVLIHRRAVPHQPTITLIPFPQIYIHQKQTRMPSATKCITALRVSHHSSGGPLSAQYHLLGVNSARPSRQQHSPSFKLVVSNHPLWNAPPSEQESYQSQPKKMRAVKAQHLHR